MDMVKKLLKFLFAGVVVCLLFLAAVLAYSYYATRDTRAMGDTFVEHIQKHELDKAYGMLHANLQKKVSLADFKNLIEKGNINTVSKVDWTQWNKGGGLEKVEGTSTSDVGGGIDVAVEITVTDIENGGKPGILAFNFQQVEKPKQ